MIREMARRTWDGIKAMDRDDRGADMVEYILLVAVIALPLLAVIIFYRDKIRDMLADMFGQVENDANMAPQ